MASISMDDLRAGRVDLSDIVTGERLPPLHPGEMLQEEFMVPLGLSAYKLAKELKVPVNRITGVIRGERSVTADTAMRLERYFGMSADFWLNLQADHDLEVARRDLAAKIEAEVQPRAQPLDHAA